ncbi:hypothetical protein HN709_00150 [Candidatus Peregrinibacteria bacterium]|nr:hypothetical protein [Candidatus Peregrinibacteria bacterium]
MKIPTAGSCDSGPGNDDAVPVDGTLGKGDLCDTPAGSRTGLVAKAMAGGGERSPGRRGGPHGESSGDRFVSFSEDRGLEGASAPFRRDGSSRLDKLA